MNRITRSALLGLACLAWVTTGCGDDNKTTDDTTTADTVSTDTSTDDVAEDVSEDTTEDTTADTTETDTVDPQVAACSAAIAARETEVADELSGWSIADPTEMIAAVGGDQAKEADYAGKYRDDLANHPGCTPRTEYGKNVEPFVSDNEADVPAGSPADSTSLPGYDCAAKVYDQPNADTTKPVVVLIHGNSSANTSWEEYFVAALAGSTQTTSAAFDVVVESAVRKQLATKLIEAGYEVIAFDARVDMVATLSDWDSASATGNPFLNIDHGWAVPMVESLLKAVFAKYPDRKVSLVGHSLGVTVIRDSLRRLYNEYKSSAANSVNPFPHLQDVILLSGANHGVSTGALCTYFTHMRGTVTCEMGDRAAFVPTYFSKVNNGPSDLFAAPCADGSYAFGERDQCEGNVVQYTTITMADIADGSYQDEFVSEASAALDLEPCVANELVTLDDYDTSGYFITNLWALLASHFGSARSDAGMALVLDKLAD
ncbi:MAG: alpha/beta hydrolase [Deltaproteobacteria bacterium]|nr:MAG: alpha/beta hydrolase [Deltaproteobacteria bacterium]